MSGRIPEKWKECITVPVFKKGEKTDPENYRGISLLGSVTKLFTKIIAEEVASTGIADEQQGFRRNRSTIDTVFILRQKTEKAIEYNKAAFMCFIDLTKAFDRVRLTNVLRILKSRKISPRIVTIIKELNSGNSTFIKMENSLTKKILISNGIRQEDNLSSILFNVIMDEIIKETKSAGRGYKLGDAEVKIVCYADEAVVSEEEDNL